MEIRLPMDRIQHGFCLTDRPEWRERIQATRQMDQTNNPNRTCMSRRNLNDGFVTCIYSYKIDRLPCILHVSTGDMYGHPEVDYMLDYIYVDPSKRGQKWSEVLFIKTIKALQALNIGVSPSCVIAVPIYEECASYIRKLANKYNGEITTLGDKTYYVFE